MPAAMEACRAGFWPCPAVRICPMITSDTSAPATPARLSASMIATLPRSWAGKLLSAPPNAPTGVRAAPTMTISFFIVGAPLIGPRVIGPGLFGPASIGPSDQTGDRPYMWLIWHPATPDVHAIWHLGYPWPAGRWRVNETKGRADLREWRQDVTTMGST